MEYKIIGDINLRKNWEIIEPILEGWSYDKKFYIEDKFDNKYLLRLSDISLYDSKKEQFENLKSLSRFNLNIPKAIEIGICNNGKDTYTLLSWIEGRDL